ncbi:MAG: Gfo/Idh/MocA family oxidoreductase [Porticoccaceae bacterium]
MKKAQVKLGILGCAKVNGFAIFDVAGEVPEIIIHGIASRDGQRARDAAEKYNVEHHYSNYESLIADPTIDAIYIPLPNNLHCNYSIAAIEAGKTVLCEKPIARNQSEALQMMERSRALGIPIVEAFHYRYHPLAIRLRELLDSGEIGKLTHIETRFRTPAGIVGPDNIRLDYDLGGGATIDPGCYCINLIRLIAGAEPEVLSATPTLQSAEIDIAMAAELVFADGCTAYFECSLSDDIETFVQVAKISGEAGSITVTNPFLPHLGNRLDIDVEGHRRSETFPTTPSYAYQLKAFADLVLSGAPSRTTLEDGIKNMKVIDDVYRAAGMRIRGL